MDGREALFGLSGSSFDGSTQDRDLSSQCELQVPAP
jgi:hypothetical protein